jgi:ribosomal protein S17E
MAKKTRRKGVRNPITGKISHYTHTKSVGLRNPITGKIYKRISKKKAKNAGLLLE